MLQFIWILFIGICFYLICWLMVIIYTKVFNTIEGYIGHTRQESRKIDIVDPYDRSSQFIESDED